MGVTATALALVSSFACSSAPRPTPQRPQSTEAPAHYLPAGTRIELPPEEKTDPVVLAVPMFAISRASINRALEAAEVARVLEEDLLQCRNIIATEERSSDRWPLILGGGVLAASVAFALGVIVAK
jgi:hypothetical protein